MKFRDYFSLKHILFAVFLMCLMILFAINQSNNMVKVYLNSDHIQIIATKYTMSVEYSLIESAELAELGDPGEKANEDAYDDDLVRFGIWNNDAWGEYYVCADPDTSNCVVLHLTDGRTFVFSRKDDAETSRLYEELLPYLSAD